MTDLQNDEYVFNIRTEVDVTQWEDGLRVFLEMAAQGAVSGRFSEWPQMKPAIRWALAEIERLTREVEQLRASAPTSHTEK